MQPAGKAVRILIRSAFQKVVGGVQRRHPSPSSSPCVRARQLFAVIERQGQPRRFRQLAKHPTYRSGGLSRFLRYRAVNQRESRTLLHQRNQMPAFCSRLGRGHLPSAPPWLAFPPWAVVCRSSAGSGSSLAASHRCEGNVGGVCGAHAE